MTQVLAINAAETTIISYLPVIQELKNILQEVIHTLSEPIRSDSKVHNTDFYSRNIFLASIEYSLSSRIQYQIFNLILLGS